MVFGEDIVLCVDVFGGDVVGWCASRYLDEDFRVVLECLEKIWYEDL